MQELFKVIKDSERANQIALDSVGRTPYPTLSIVTNVSDPANRRRIKVALPSSPGLESDWIRRLQTHPFIDPPLPTVGQTVLLFYADGNESNAFYLSIVNDTNPPANKDDIIKDYSEVIPGDKLSTVRGDDSLTVDGKITTNADDIKWSSEKDIAAEVKGNIFMNALQAITLQAAQYVMFKAGTWAIKIFSNGTTQMSGGVLTIDCGGFGFHLTNVGTMTINGKSITTLGAVDSRGDSLVQRGW
ncbi:hypothetical protein H6G76_35120 [Nostoc sp. FACHB-152]|uniref:hypothetical protein n=1 Tax=Nostoc sp. FACHB-152 TaxID=2692837 RepID=UPI001681E1D4|nr:hypothetical protein [Nostoc sp. FACHB-152]MBD2452243.1 hypothetical protein [Nostoc sp. FACHB-152]